MKWKSLLLLSEMSHTSGIPFRAQADHPGFPPCFANPTLPVRKPKLTQRFSSVCFHWKRIIPTIPYVYTGFQQTSFKTKPEFRIQLTSNLKSSTVFDIRDNSQAGNKKNRWPGSGPYCWEYSCIGIMWCLAWKSEAALTLHQLCCCHPAKLSYLNFSIQLPAHWGFQQRWPRGF